MSSTRTGNLSINSCTYHLHSLPVSDKWSCGSNKHQSCWSSYHSTIFYQYSIVIYDVSKVLLPMELFGNPMIMLFLRCNMIILFMIILFLRSYSCFRTLVLLIRPQMSLRVFMLLIFLVFFCTFFFLLLFQFNVDKMCNVYKF
jgi:hypothetical protein